jgi:hypothetical protein
MSIDYNELYKEVLSMADNAKKILRLRQTRANTKENVGQLNNNKSESGTSKTCPSCSNPRWDKTARKS